MANPQTAFSAHSVATFLESTGGFFKLATIPLLVSVFLFIWWDNGHQHYQGADINAYRANAQAADEFVSVVNAVWPYKQSLVLEKLDRLVQSYEATGELDSAKIGELARLERWAIAASSVADERQYLIEVRTNGWVVARAPFFANPALIIIGVSMIWGLWIILYVILYVVVMTVAKIASGLRRT